MRRWESSGDCENPNFVREKRSFFWVLILTMVHHSTDDDSELEVRPDGATMLVQQSVDAPSSSDSRPLQEPDSSSAVSNHTITITVSHDSSDHLLHVPDRATFGIKKTLLFCLFFCLLIVLGLIHFLETRNKPNAERIHHFCFIH